MGKIMKTFNFKQVSMIAVLLLVINAHYCLSQTGNHVFTGAEAGNFGIISLSTPGGQTWSTYRGAIPGYFSAIGAASYTGASDAANINGYVKHYATNANQPFSFPVGSGTDYRNLSVSGNRSATSVIATAWIAGNPSVASDPTNPNIGAHPITAVEDQIKLVSSVGQWDWQDLRTSSAGVTVTVSIPDLSNFGPASNLRLVGWDGSQWVNLSGTRFASGNTQNSTLQGTMINGITALGVGLFCAAGNVAPTIN
jgi:hypothetical protein